MATAPESSVAVAAEGRNDVDRDTADLPNGGGDDCDDAVDMSPVTSPTESLKRRNRAQSTIRRVVRVTNFLSQASFLPMAVDKVRNNVRSPALLVSVYVFAVLLVSAVVVLGLRQSDPTRMSFKTVVAPPANVRIAEPWSTFSVQLTDDGGAGLGGRDIYLSASPLEDVPLRVEVSRGSVAVTGSVNCLEQMILPFGRGSLSLIPQCIPNSAGLLYPAKVTTDVFGIATFSNVTLAAGFPGAYVFVITLDSSHEIFVTHFLNVEANNVTLSIDADAPELPRVVELRRPYNFSVIAEWSALRHAVPNSSVGLLPYPRVVAGSVAAVELMSDGTTLAAPTAPIGPTGTTAGAIGADAGTAINTNIERIIVAADGVSAAAGATTVNTPVIVRYRARLDFRNVVFYAPNSMTVHIGVLCLGQAIPLRLVAHESQGMSPRNLITPSVIGTDVAAVFASVVPGGVGAGGPSIGGDATTFNVTEGRPFVVRVRALAANGAALARRVAFVRLELDNRSHTVALELVHDAPINNINVKQLIGQVNVTGTDATGTTQIDTRLTVIGAVAAYRLVAVVDGVEAVFVANEGLSTVTAAQYKDAPHDRKSIQCLAQSRAASIVVRMAPGFAAQVETVASNWVMLPEVRILDAAGTPLPGKYVGIVPDRSDPATRDADIVVIGTSKISDDDGVGTFVHIAVMSSKHEGSFRFLLSVDGLLQNVTRTIRWPASVASDPRPYQLPGACAAVKPQSLPANVFSNTAASLVFAVVDIFGNPTTDGTVTQIVDPQAYADGGPPTSLPIIDGQVNITVNAPPVWRPTVLLATYACSAVSEDATMSVAATQVALPVNPRVKSVSLHIDDVNNPGAVAVVTVDAHWSAVSAATPITVTAAPVWSAAFVRFYYPAERQVVTQTVPVSGPEDATVTLTSDHRSPGTVWVVFVVDNFVTAINYPDVFAPEVTRLELVRSAFNDSAAASTVLRIMELTERPQVRLFGVGTSFVNDSFVFAQVGVVSASNATDIDWIEPASDVSKLQAAGLSAVDDAGEPAKVVSTPSDTAGLATLPRMRIVGSKAGLVLKIRYCYAADLLLQLANTTSVATICVVEPTALHIPDADELRLTPLSPFVAAAPGGYVPALSVQLSWAQRSPAYALLDLPAFSFVIVMPSDGSPLRYIGGLSPTVASANHTFTITGLVIDSGAVTGAYTVDIVGPGCRTSFAVAVSAAPADMLVVVQPSPRLFVGMYSVAVVIVQGVGGVPLPSKRVEMAVDRATDDCTGGGCGTLSPSSFTFGSTGSKGFFLGTFAVATGATGSYRLRFRVVDAPSSAATRQLTGAQIALFTYSMGLPRALMFEEVVRIDPRLALTAGIIDKMLDPSETANAIGSGSGGGTTKAAAASSRDRIEETFVRYFATSDTGNRDAASALGMASSDMLNALSATAAEASTAEFFIENAVESIVVLQEPDVLVEYSVSTSAVNSLLSLDRKVQMTDATAPRVQLLDKFGNPVPSTPVTFTATPSGLAVEFPLAGIVSDGDGVASFAGTVVSSPDSGEFTLAFSSRGSRGNATTVPVRFDITRRSSEETMKLFAFVLCAGLSPMFLATVPHSWWVYGVFGSLFTLGLAIAATTLLATNWTDIVTNGFVYAYAVSGLLFVWVAAGGYAALSVVDVFSKFMWRSHQPQSKGRALFKMVDVNREDYGAGILQYTTWLINARVEKPEPAPELGRMEKLITALKQSAADRMENVSGKAQTTRQALTQRLIGDDDETGTVSKTVTVQGAEDRPPLIRPSRIRDPTLYPPNLLVVMALAFALTLLLNFLAVHAVAVMHSFLNGLLGYLPRPTDDENLEEINETVTAAISVTFSALAASRPELAFLAAAVGPIKRLNLVSAAVTLRRLVEALERRLDVSSAAGLIVANLIVLVSGVATLLHTKTLIRHQRRWGGTSLGPAFATPQVGRIETYIGLHCMHFVLVFIVVAALVFIVLLALLAEPVRLFLWEKGKVLLIASISSVAISLALRLFFVKLFLLDGWHIVRPEIHALFSFFDLVLGVFTGAVGTVVRWVQTVVFFTICFAKLDRPMYPFPFSSLDKAHVGFAAMVGAEANNSHPVYITFAAMLLLDRHVKAAVATEQLQREAAACESGEDSEQKANQPPPTLQARSANLRHGWEHAISGDGGRRLNDERDALHRFERSAEPQLRMNASEFADHRGISANVLNVMRSLLRSSGTHVGANGDIDVALALRRRRFGRIANRWWLLLLLARNPSLRAYRKCRTPSNCGQHDEAELAARRSTSPVAV